MRKAKYFYLEYTRRKIESRISNLFVLKNISLRLIILSLGIALTMKNYTCFKMNLKLDTWFWNHNDIDIWFAAHNFLQRALFNTVNNIGTLPIPSEGKVLMKSSHETANQVIMCLNVKLLYTKVSHHVPWLIRFKHWETMVLTHTHILLRFLWIKLYSLYN